MLLLQQCSICKWLQSLIIVINFASSSLGSLNLSIPPMLLHGERLFKVAHEVTPNIMHLWPLFEHEHYTQYNERGR